MKTHFVHVKNVYNSYAIASEAQSGPVVELLDLMEANTIKTLRRRLNDANEKTQYYKDLFESTQLKLNSVMVQYDARKI